MTEWVDAIPLEQLLTTSMTPTQSVEVTRRVAEAIGHIHSAGLRDAWPRSSRQRDD